MSENIEKLTALMWCDGSSKPNPGPYGGGCHGYLFYDKDVGFKNNDRLTIFNTTEEGYVDSKLFPRLNIKEVKPSFYYDAVYPYKGLGTNNQAEAMSIIDTVTNLIKNENLPIKTIIIKTDSNYAISIHSKIRESNNRDWDNSEKLNLGVVQIEFQA